MLRKSISSPLVRFCHGLQSNTSGVDDVVAAEIRDDVVAVAADDDVGAVVANDPLGGFVTGEVDRCRCRPRKWPRGVQDDLVPLTSLQSQFACERFAFSPAM